MRASVLTSGIWQTSSTILEHGEASLVIDPAYFPRELDAIAAAVTGRVEAVVFTHGHWDHVMGHAQFGAPVWLGKRLDASIADDDPRVAKYLDDARDFDSRWYVERAAPYAWPARRRALADGDTVDLAGSPIRVLELAGHSYDGIALVIEELGLLLPGDHLSPCEIPFVEDAHAYRATLVRLIDLLASLREVIPGHGPRMPAADALAIARADLEYIDRLIDVGVRRDFMAAAVIPLPRAQGVVGMRDHHRDNLRKLGIAVG